MSIDLTISVEDRPGELRPDRRGAREAQVSTSRPCAGSAWRGAGSSTCAWKTPTSARQALDAAGLKVEGEADADPHTEPMPGSDEPGTMGMMARKIADAGINVKVPSTWGPTVATVSS